MANSSIDKCVFAGAATINGKANWNFGGIVGEVGNNTSVKNSYVSGAIHLKSGAYDNLGGIVGKVGGSNTSVIENCTTVGEMTIEISGGGYTKGIGGILGFAETGSNVTISNCFRNADVNVTVDSWASVSGILPRSAKARLREVSL